MKLTYDKFLKLIAANKLILGGLIIGASVAAPATFFVQERSSNTDVRDQKEVLSETEIIEQKLSTLTDNNEEAGSSSTPEESSAEQASQSVSAPSVYSNEYSPNNQSAPDPSENRNDDESSPDSQAKPTNSNKTEGPRPEPSVDDWSAQIVSYSPTDCGEERNKCTVGTEVEMSVIFRDTTSERQISISKCTASGFQGAGPQTDDPYKQASATVVNGDTCNIRFVAPNYGEFVIWADVYTDESTVRPHKGFNLKWFWFQD